MSKNYKWLLIALLSGAFFFHQADRALFGLLTVPIQNELKLTDIQIGWINTILSWTLAAMTVIAGFVGDRYSRKWVITLSLIAWSLMTVCMGFVGGFIGALFFRSIATGIGESFYVPSAYALIAVHHKETRSVALSIHQAALYVGLMISGVLVARALGFLGSWRHVFMAFGLAGFVLGILFIFVLKDRAREAIESGDSENRRIGQSLCAYFCNPSALLATTGFVAIVFVNNAYLFWAPKFAAQKFYPQLFVSDPKAAVTSVSSDVMLWHHLLAFGAIMFGGFVTDVLVRRYPRARLGFQILALLLGAPMLLWVGLAPTFVSMIVAASAYGVFRGFFEVNTHASLFDVIPPAHRSAAVGFINMIAFFFGGLSGIVMGVLSERYGTRGFEYGFMMMAGAYALAAVLMSLSFFFTFKRNRVIE